MILVTHRQSQQWGPSESDTFPSGMAGLVPQAEQHATLFNPGNCIAMRQAADGNADGHRKDRLG